MLLQSFIPATFVSPGNTFSGKALAILPWHRTIRDIETDTGHGAQLLRLMHDKEGRMDAKEVVLAVREGRSLAGQNLSGIDLSGQDLSKAQLKGANLSGSDLRKADLRGADLSNANLYDADMRGARLRNANLAGSNRMLAKILKWGLKGAYITGPTAYVD